LEFLYINRNLSVEVCQSEEIFEDFFGSQSAHTRNAKIFQDYANRGVM